MFQKILIANRGEIACRVIRTAKRLGIRTVAVYSDADANALHVDMADEAIHIGGSAPADSYLKIESVIEAALKTGCEAIHPGYGFLSENAAFSERCNQNNIVFIGPPTNAIKTMGSKSAAKQMMEHADVPLLPGYHGKDQDPKKLKQAAEKIGYPVLLKAVSGGGGKGMRQIETVESFDEGLKAAKREALSGFGDDDMLVEKYLLAPRHVEVQVFCDTFGNGVYLFERDCSIQRRHQKIIEEAPAPGISPALRAQMGEAALRAAAAVNYVGAGTVEFLLDKNGRFYFMEMNTRLQVEHPVTEMITGQDLVEWQLKVADGQPLPCSQAELSIKGHAFEARVYAEDPSNQFLPSAGKVVWLRQPESTRSVRIDTGVVEGDEVGVYYDPMIAKIIVWGEDRPRALKRLAAALSDYRIIGMTTNVQFLQQLASHPAFIAEALSTDFIVKNESSLFKIWDKAAATQEPTLVPVACLYLLLKREWVEPSVTDPNSPWHARDDWRTNAPAQRTETLMIEGEELTVLCVREGTRAFLMTAGDETWRVSGHLDSDTLTATVDGHRTTNTVVTQSAIQSAIQSVAQAETIHLFNNNESLTFISKPIDLGEEIVHDDGTGFKAPMNGTMVDVLVTTGDSVAAGDTLVIMEAMKMEHAIKAPSDGTVVEIFFAEGDLLEGGADLLSFEPKENS